MKAYRYFWPHFCLLGFVVVTACSSYFHEPWRDEAQAWLIARDAPLRTVITQAGYEGTPLLWHFILMPFARLGAPYFSMHVIHLLIAYAIVYLFLFRSNFSKTTRVLFVFSYFMFWEYAVIARNYSLSILLIFLIAVIYEKKLSRPLLYTGLLLLLFNTNVHSIPIAIGLSLAWVYEARGALKDSTTDNKLFLAAAGILLSGFALAVFQLIPAPDNINRGLFHIFSWKRPFIAMANAFFPLIPRTANLTLLASVMIVLSSGVYLFQKDRKAFFVLAVAYLGISYIFAFKHTGSLRHHGLLLIFLLFAYWIAGPSPENDRPARLFRLNIAALNLGLLLSLFFSVEHHYLEYRYQFSGAERLAAFIDANLGGDPIIVAHPSIKASAAAPYLPATKFWYADAGEYGTYITWNTAYEAGKEMPAQEAVQKAEAFFGAANRRLFFLLDEALPENEDSQYLLIFKTEGRVFGYGEERYFLYTPAD